MWQAVGMYLGGDPRTPFGSLPVSMQVHHSHIDLRSSLDLEVIRHYPRIEIYDVHHVPTWPIHGLLSKPSPTGEDLDATASARSDGIRKLPAISLMVADDLFKGVLDVRVAFKNTMVVEEAIRVIQLHLWAG